MDSKLRTYVHDATLRARKLLTTEVQELLEGVYGCRAGQFEPTNRLPGLLTNSEAMATRRHLEKFIADETVAGLRSDQALNKLVKEVAFTHLNRLVAFKMMESRKLIRGTIDKLHESNAFKFYLAASGHADDYARYQAGDQPQDVLGEGPRDVAYRHFLLWQTAQVAQEIRVLFDPDNLASRLFPRPRALRETIQLLNTSELQNAWLPESDETIGWVYQYFNEQEKAEVFERLYKQKRKIQAEDIPAATELFTPRWIVRFLVENTLGRLWVQMHPESSIQESLAYLVSLAGESPRAPVKPVREIAVLDPACGTMHFGLVAFDLLARMYQEELENAGRSGWPERPSVSNADEIPAAIIEHNLHGIDIDLRAVQLSALTLYLKAKTLNPSAKISASNLACADVLLLNSDRLDEFLRQSDFSRPIYERVVRALWSRLGSASVAGSLVRVEAEITGLVQRERQRYEREGRQRDFLGIGETNFEETATAEGFWETLEAQVVRALDEFVRAQAASGVDEAYFTGEAAKGLRLLDLMIRRYDIVVTNPPYMSRQNVSGALAEFLATAYSRSKGDLYAAFIERCAEFLDARGRMGMITQQSFMFLPSYEHMRKSLITSHVVETMCHLGPRAFGEIAGEKVNTTMFVLRQEGDAAQRDQSTGVYFRLVRVTDAEAKRVGFERALAELIAGRADPAVFRYRQKDFDVISGMPWVYRITPELRRLFETLPKLGDIAKARQGLATADNFRFIRLWWEVGRDRIAFTCATSDDAMKSRKRWFPHMKGGESRRWWGNQKHIVNWADDGAEMKEYICLSYPYLNGKWEWVAKNSNYYFRPGLTYAAVGSKFASRLMPVGFVFDSAADCLFPDDSVLLRPILGILNSAFTAFVLQLLNETVNVATADIERLPLPGIASNSLSELVNAAISLAEDIDEKDETSYEFVAPAGWSSGVENMDSLPARLAEAERQIDAEVYRLYGVAPGDRGAIQTELSEQAVSGPEAGEDDMSEDGPTPLDAAHDVPQDGRDMALRWISYAIGIVFGRFQPGVEGTSGRGDFSGAVLTGLRSLRSEEGLTVLDSGHAADLADRVERALVLMFGESGAAQVVKIGLGNRGSDQAPLRRFLERDFFKWHAQLYRKRPIYWLLQSAKRSYSLYVYHERITRDTLYMIQGNGFLGGKINQTRRTIEELQGDAKKMHGAKLRGVERELDQAHSLLGEVEEFAKELRGITEAPNERGQIVGWTPELDDGVILNLAPLHRILPSWAAEPRKYWGKLEAGVYDWSHTAMRYWPERVTAKCRNDKSYAIGHSLLNVYEAAVS